MEISPENKRIFEAARDHLDQASLKNSEQLDKAILTLSSAGLALSLTFPNTLVDFAKANNIWVLEISWLLFTISIISTLVSFLTSASAISVERDHIYKYYIEGKDEYEKTSNRWGIITYYVNRLSVLIFVTAVAFTVFYVWSNVPVKEDAMSNKPQTSPEKRGYVPPKKQPTDNGSSNPRDQSNKPAKEK